MSKDMGRVAGLVVALSCSAALASQPASGDARVEVKPAFNAADLRTLFDGQPLAALAPLAPQEMAETSGARWGSGAALHLRAGLADLAWIQRSREQQHNLMLRSSRVWLVQ
jgi:hypothetical protein